MTRINIWTEGHDDDHRPTRSLDGWFDIDKATDVRELYGIENLPYRTKERLYRTVGGRWVKRYAGNLSWPDSYTFIAADEASQWMIRHGYAEIIDTFFGPGAVTAAHEAVDAEDAEDARRWAAAYAALVAYESQEETS